MNALNVFWLFTNYGTPKILIDKYECIKNQMFLFYAIQHSKTHEINLSNIFLDYRMSKWKLINIYERLLSQLDSCYLYHIDVMSSYFVGLHIPSIF